MKFRREAGVAVAAGPVVVVEVLGNGLASDTHIGPLANARRLAAMDMLVKDAADRGAEIVTGGARVGNRGYFFQPTILAGVPEDALAMTSEPFGPVALVSSFADLDEAIAKANRNPVGLAGYAFTNSHAAAMKVREELEVGVLGINSFAVSQTEAPFGGVKESGYGYEGGAEALDSYLHRKYVHHA